LEQLAVACQKYQHPDIICFGLIQIDKAGSWHLRVEIDEQEERYFTDKSNWCIYLASKLSGSNFIQCMSYTRLYRRLFLQESGFLFPEYSRNWEDAINYLTYFTLQSCVILPNYYYRYYYNESSTTNVASSDLNMASIVQSLAAMHAYYQKNKTLIADATLDALLTFMYLERLARSYQQALKVSEPHLLALIKSADNYLRAMIAQPQLLSSRLDGGLDRVGFYSTLANKAAVKAWLLSVEQSLPDEKKDLLLRALWVKKSSKEQCKEAIKLCLPYGVTQAMLKKRGWDMIIQRRDA
jgi:hypothetical protein